MLVWAFRNRRICRYYGLFVVYFCEGCYIFWRTVCCCCISREASDEDEDMVCGGKLDTRKDANGGKMAFLEEW